MILGATLGDFYVSGSKKTGEQKSVTARYLRLGERREGGSKRTTM